jgi:hypothetical protein
MRSTIILAAGAGALMAVSGCGAVDRVTADDHYTAESDPCPRLRSVASELLGPGFQDDPRKLQGQDCGWKVDIDAAKPATPTKIVWEKMSAALVVFRPDGMLSGERAAEVNHEKVNPGPSGLLKCPNVAADCLYSVNTTLNWVTVSVRDRNRTVTGTLEASANGGSVASLPTQAEVTRLGKALAAVP